MSARVRIKQLLCARARAHAAHFATEHRRRHDVRPRRNSDAIPCIIFWSHTQMSLYYKFLINRPQTHLRTKPNHRVLSVPHSARMHAEKYEYTCSACGVRARTDKHIIVPTFARTHARTPVCHAAGDSGALTKYHTTGKHTVRRRISAIMNAHFRVQTSNSFAPHALAHARAEYVRCVFHPSSGFVGRK